MKSKDADQYTQVNQESDRRSKNTKTSEKGRKNKVIPIETEDNLLSEQSDNRFNKHMGASAQKDLNLKSESNKQKFKIETSMNESAQGSEEEKSGQMPKMRLLDRS